MKKETTYKRGKYAQTQNSFCLWCGKPIVTKAGGKFCTETSTCRTSYCRAEKNKVNRYFAHNEKKEEG